LYGSIFMNASSGAGALVAEKGKAVREEQERRDRGIREEQGTSRDGSVAAGKY
jgi:hypothetical protein